MVAIAKVGTPSLASLTPGQDKTINGLVAGEAIAAGDACYINAADGKAWRSTGTAVNAAAKVRGYALGPAGVNEPVTLVYDVVMRYGSGLTPGADVFLDTAAGGLNTAATTGGTAPIGWVRDATRIWLGMSRY